MEEPPVVGVDFGSDNSLVATVGSDGPLVIPNDIEDFSTPSCVYLPSETDTSSVRFGQMAVRDGLSDPDNFYSEMKYNLANPNCKRDADKCFEITALYLTELKKQADGYFQNEYINAVLTVPPFFNSSQRRALSDAAQVALFNDVRIVNETTAVGAAYAYRLKLKTELKAAIIDIGAGGGCVSVIRASRRNVRVLASSQKRLPGGNDFDKQMISKFMRGIVSQYGEITSDSKFLRSLSHQWQLMKAKLSRVSHATFSLFHLKVGEIKFAVKREEFEAECNAMFQTIVEELEAVLKQSKVSVEKIDHVILVGASTRIPYLRSLIKNKFNNNVTLKAINPDEAVAMGAALIGKGKCEITDVTSIEHCIEYDRQVLRIKPGCRLPHEDKLMANLNHLKVSQGNENGTAILEAGKELLSNVKGFQLDTNGHFYLVDECKNHITITLNGCLNAEKLEKLRSKSKLQKALEKEELERLEAKNALEEKCRELLTPTELNGNNIEACDATKVESKAILEWLHLNPSATKENFLTQLDKINMLRITATKDIVDQLKGAVTSPSNGDVCSSSDSDDKSCLSEPMNPSNDKAERNTIPPHKSESSSPGDNVPASKLVKPAETNNEVYHGVPDNQFPTHPLVPAFPALPNQHVSLPHPEHRFPNPPLGHHFPMPPTGNHFMTPPLVHHYALPHTANHFMNPPLGHHFPIRPPSFSHLPQPGIYPFPNYAYPYPAAYQSTPFPLHHNPGTNHHFYPIIPQHTLNYYEEQETAPNTLNANDTNALSNEPHENEKVTADTNDSDHSLSEIAQVPARDTDVDNFLKVLQGNAFGEEISVKDFKKENQVASESEAEKQDSEPGTKSDEDIDVESDSEQLADRGMSTAKKNAWTLKDIQRYLEGNGYPEGLTKVQKRNLRGLAQASFRIRNEKLQHKTHSGKKTDHGRATGSFPDWANVLVSRKKQTEVIKLAHEGSDKSVQAESLAAHRGINSTIDLVGRRWWWPNLTTDVKAYVKTCETCQKVDLAVLKAKDPLRPVPPPSKTLKQIGVDIIQMPPVQGYKYAVIAIDYLSKYCHGKPLKTKEAKETALFLFDWICLFGVPEIVINDQGTEFVNQVSNELSLLTGVTQRVTNPYHPQANGLVERQNKTIKAGLLKTLGAKENIDRWPDALNGVMFAHRVQKQRSTNMSPYYILFGREPVIPIDFVQSEEDVDDVEQCSELAEEDKKSDVSDHPTDIRLEDILSAPSTKEEDDYLLDLKTFVHKYDELKKQVLSKAKEQIKKSQRTMKVNYDKRHQGGSMFKVNDLVLKKNLRRDERKGDWKQIPWTGPFIIITIKNGSYFLKNKKTGRSLAQGVSAQNLKLFRGPESFGSSEDEENCDQEKKTPNSSRPSSKSNRKEAESDKEKRKQEDDYNLDESDNKDKVSGKIDQVTDEKGNLDQQERKATKDSGDKLDNMDDKDEVSGKTDQVEDKNANFDQEEKNATKDSGDKLDNMDDKDEVSGKTDQVEDKNANFDQEEKNATKDNGDKLDSRDDKDDLGDNIDEVEDDPEDDILVKPIETLLNANKCKPVELPDGRIVNLSNTCAIDATVHILANAYKVSGKYRSSFETNDEDIDKLIETVAKEGPSKNAYLERAKVLNHHFGPSRQGRQRNVQINCNMNANGLAILFSKSPSAIEERVCNGRSCPEPLRHIPQHILSFQVANEGLDGLEEILRRWESKVQEATCHLAVEGIGDDVVLYDKKLRCNGETMILRVVQKRHLFFELVERNKHFRAESTIKLGSVPQNIQINRTDFRLRGVIEFVGGRNPSKSAMGHYRAYVLIGSNWIQYDDLTKDRQEASQDRMVRSHQLIYTI